MKKKSRIEWQMESNQPTKLTNKKIKQNTNKTNTDKQPTKLTNQTNQPTKTNQPKLTNQTNQTN